MRIDRIKKIATLIKVAAWKDVRDKVSKYTNQFLTEGDKLHSNYPVATMTPIVLANIEMNFDKILNGTAELRTVLTKMAGGTSSTYFRNGKGIEQQDGFDAYVQNLLPILNSSNTDATSSPAEAKVETKEVSEKPPVPSTKKEQPKPATSKDSPDAWKVFGDKAELVKSTWIKRSTKLKRLTTHANFKLWLTRNNIAEKLENADAIIAKLSAEIGEQPPATAPAAQATTAPESKKPEEGKTEAKPTEAKPASPTEFTDKEKRMAIALGAMGNEKLVGTKGIDLVREIPRINAIVTFLGSWENMARVILKRNPSLSPSMPADLGKEGVMIDKNYVNANLKWFQVTQDTINAVYNSSEKSKGVISSIPGYKIQREESKADDGHSKKSSYRSRSNRIGMIREIARS